MRNRISEDNPLNAHKSLPKIERSISIPISPGHAVSENHNYVTQNQNDFFASSKVFFKPNVPSITALNMNKLAAPVS